MARLVTIAAIPVVYLVFLRLMNILFFSGTACRSQATLHGKTVIVTGANVGIGKTTAIDMAARGARVIMACRSEKRTLPVVEEIKEKTKNSDVIFMRLDLSDFESVRTFARTFLANEKRLDILVNNAGMFSPELSLDKNGIESTMVVNHLGHFLLTNLLSDILVESGPGSRIVNVGSVAYNFANPKAFVDFADLKIDGTAEFPADVKDVFIESNTSRYIPTFLKKWFFQKMISIPGFVRYSNSKLANILFTKELARRFLGSGVTAYVLHPGYIRTEIGKPRDAAGAVTDQRSGWKSLALEYLNPLHYFAKTLEMGAETTICCAVGEEYADYSGLYYSDCRAEPVARREAENSELAVRFWDWSQSLTEA